MHLLVIVNCLCCFISLIACSSGNRSPETGPSVILIGAGPAGIAGAARLLANNITNVIILEAENRIGGRIQSINFGKGVLDLGAEWCHGDEDNIVYELANTLNLLELDPVKNFTFFHSSQKSLDNEFLGELEELAFTLYEERKDGVNSSLGTYIVERFNAAIAKTYGSNQEKVKLAHEFLSFFQVAVLSEEGAFSVFDVAANTNLEMSDILKNYIWKGRGYKTILDVLTQKYPDPSKEIPVYKSIVFNKDVVRVAYDESTPSVVCSDNTTYTADHVIWTPSLGVLKHRYQYLFNPELPKQKVDAVTSLGIAGVSKIILYFPEVWWPEHIYLFGFIWSDEDSQRVQNNGTKEDLWILSLQILTVNTYEPNILTAWICGEIVPTVEKLDDEVIINGTMFVLQKFLGHQFHNISRPQQILRENWYTNDHFRGTYSYDTVQSYAENVPHRSNLAEPLKTTDGKPVVLFAGEATNPIHYGTVHGAIETGRREADRIINYYKTI